MSPARSYRHLFRLASTWFVVVGFLARIPIAMAQLATLLLVAGVTGSYGMGGATAGALAIANAVGSPISGALSDRFGQRPVLLLQSVISATALVALVLSAESRQAWTVMLLCAVIAGLSLPQSGSLARIRWKLLATKAQKPRLVDTAFALEGALDEASFVVGPALVGGLAAIVSPSGALVAAAVMSAVFGVAFALHPTAELTRPDHSQRTAQHGPIVTGPFALLLATMLSLGMVFGSVQTGNSVLATAAGEPGLTGGLHALLGIGSVIAGLLVPALPTNWSPQRRLVIFAGGLLVLSLPLLAVNSIGLLIVVLLALGFSLAPTMITTFTLAAAVAPAQRITTALGILGGMIGVGYAIGSTIAGRLADLGGHQPAFAVTVAGGALALTFSLIVARFVRVPAVSTQVALPTETQPAS